MFANYFANYRREASPDTPPGVVTTGAAIGLAILMVTSPLLVVVGVSFAADPDFGPGIGIPIAGIGAGLAVMCAIGGRYAEGDQTTAVVVTIVAVSLAITGALFLGAAFAFWIGFLLMAGNLWLIAKGNRAADSPSSADREA